MQKKLNTLQIDSKILITGATGMVGSVLYAKLKKEGFTKIVAPGVTCKRVDLTDQLAVQKLFKKNKFEYVFHLAAKVGGIQANIHNPVDFLQENLLINTFIFDNCYKTYVKKVLYLGSSCIYPALCDQPMRESYLLSGRLEPTNEGYSLSKICGLKLAEYYFSQYGLKSVCLMPSNIYGTNDHYDLTSAHVLSSLIKKFVDAKNQGDKSVTLWGNGEAKREFIHVDDVVSAILFFFEKVDTPDIINIGTNKDLTIKRLANIIAEKVGYTGKIQYDESKPNGMLRKCLDVSKMLGMGFSPKVELIQGIQRSIKEYTEVSNNG